MISYCFLKKINCDVSKKLNLLTLLIPDDEVN